MNTTETTEGRFPVASHRFPYNDHKVHGDGGLPQWLRVIREVNKHRPDTFGQPVSTGPWWAGGYVEEYPDARVILPAEGRSEEEGVLILALTDEVAAALAAAAVTDEPEPEPEQAMEDYWAERGQGPGADEDDDDDNDEGDKRAVLYAWTVEGDLYSGDLAAYARSREIAHYDGTGTGPVYRLTAGTDGAITSIAAAIETTSTGYDRDDLALVTVTDPVTGESASYRIDGRA